MVLFPTMDAVGEAQELHIREGGGQCMTGF